MALTPSEVKNKSFTITKFRDGFDQDEVDDFLEEIVNDLKARDAEKAALEEQIAQLQADLEAAQESAAQPAEQPAEQPQPAASTPSADAQKSSAMLQLALELHDKHVHEGETKRDQLIQEGENKAQRLVADAEAERTNVLNALSAERVRLEEKITSLRDFEKEYRDTLTSYIEAQLRNLESENEPAGGPQTK